MKDFTYYAPTQVVFGKESESKVGRLVKQYGGTIKEHAPIVLSDPTNYHSRAQIMWTGSLAHNDLTGFGTTGDWSTSTAWQSKGTGLVFLTAFWTYALDYIVEGVYFIPFWKIDRWNRKVLKTYGPMAYLTVEMQVLVIVFAFIKTVAHFVSDPFTPIINTMKQMIILQKRKGSENN